MSETSVCDLFRTCFTQLDDSDWRRLVDDRRVERSLHAVVHHQRHRFSDEDLEDLVQEVYCRLLSDAGQRFRGRAERQLWCYLRCIARSVVIDWRRAREVERRAIERVCASRPAGRAGDGSKEPPSSESTPEEVLLTKERRHRLFEHCVRSTRGRRRRGDVRALVLALFAGWSSREIATALDGLITPQRIDRLVCRMRQRLAARDITLPQRRGAALRCRPAAANGRRQRPMVGSAR